jgi:hypothetical protein
MTYRAPGRTGFPVTCQRCVARYWSAVLIMIWATSTTRCQWSPGPEAPVGQILVPGLTFGDSLHVARGYLTNYRFLPETGFIAEVADDRSPVRSVTLLAPVGETPPSTAPPIRGVIAVAREGRSDELVRKVELIAEGSYAAPASRGCAKLDAKVVDDVKYWHSGGGGGV